MGIIFGSYFLDAMAKAASAVDWLGYISPFHYLGFSTTDPDYSVNYIGIIILLALGVSLLWFDFKTYSKRDING